jgi:hypothetical protein
MSEARLPRLLQEGEDLFATLERETFACLNNLESLPWEEIECFVARRQELLTAIQKFDAEFNGCSGEIKWSAEHGAAVSPEKFRQRLAGSLRRVIEADGLLIALGGRDLTLLRAGLTAVAQGRRALDGYLKY